MNKKDIANACEKVIKELVNNNSQVIDGKIIWYPSGSTLSNMLFNVTKIDDVDVSEEFNSYAYNYIRQPKGDIDVVYTKGIRVYVDFNNITIKNYQSISKEQRDYNFIDHLNDIKKENSDELCLMETKEGFKFITIKPQFLFLHKAQELLSSYSECVLNNNIDDINNKNTNILYDVQNLFGMSVSYFGLDNTINSIKNIYFISNTLKELHGSNPNDYDLLVNGFISNILSIKERQNKNV